MLWHLLICFVADVVFAYHTLLMMVIFSDLVSTLVFFFSFLAVICVFVIVILDLWCREINIKK